MYAIVEIAGQQLKVEKAQHAYVNRLQGNEGDTVEFNEVLLIDNDGNVNVGAPVIEGAVVKATILGHLKGDKVIVFKKKRRKGYAVKNGHRQYLTEIEISEISEKGGTKKKAAKKAAPKKEEKKEEPVAEVEETPVVEAAPAEEAPKTEAAAAPVADATPEVEAAPEASSEEETKSEE